MCLIDGAVICLVCTSGSLEVAHCFGFGQHRYQSVERFLGVRNYLVRGQHKPVRTIIAELEAHRQRGFVITVRPIGGRSGVDI